MEKLLCLSGINKNEEFFLDDQLSIGRSAQNDICIADKKSSRKHCVIEKRGDHIYLIDLDSTNGTQLNENYISGEIEIHIDSFIKIGRATFKLFDESTTRVFADTNPIKKLKSEYHNVRYIETETTMMRKLKARQSNKSSYVSFLKIEK